MARIHFQKASNPRDPQHTLTVKEARYVRKFKTHRSISIIMSSIALLELVIILFFRGRF